MLLKWMATRQRRKSINRFTTSAPRNPGCGSHYDHRLQIEEDGGRQPLPVDEDGNYSIDDAEGGGYLNDELVLSGKEQFEFDPQTIALRVRNALQNLDQFRGRQPSRSQDESHSLSCVSLGFLFAKAPFSLENKTWDHYFQISDKAPQEA